MSRHHDPRERGGGATGCLVGVGRAFFICALVITVLGLIGMGGILGLAHLTDQPLQIFSDALQDSGISNDFTDDLRFPALWENLAAPIYTCAAIAALSLVALFVIRRPKPTRHTSMEGPA